MARDSVKVARIFHASIRMSVDAQCVWRRMQNRKESNHHAASAKKHSKVGAQIALKLSRRKSRYVNFKLSDKKGRLCEGGGGAREKKKNETDDRHISVFADVAISQSTEVDENTCIFIIVNSGLR